MDWLNFVFGVSGIVAVLIQYSEIFSTHKEAKRYIGIFAIGSFVGSLISTVSNSKIELAIAFSGFNLLCGALTTAIVIVIVAAAFSASDEKRSALMTFSSVLFLPLLLILAFGNIGPTEKSKSLQRIMEISLDEYIALSRLSEENKNYARAIILLEMAKLDLQNQDKRLEMIDSKIESIKVKQVLK